MVKIYIDPGHGGTDPGAVGNGLQEKALILQISNRIRDLLAGYSNAEVKMSRTGDQTVSLAQRTTDANNLGADFFLSIHPHQCWRRYRLCGLYLSGIRSSNNDLSKPYS
ncbi:N-acetylmuramoyl-L-alanine amidase [Cytobacillus horneckiae]